MRQSGRKSSLQCKHFCRALGGFIGSTGNRNHYAKTAGDTGRKPTQRRLRPEKKEEEFSANLLKKIQSQEDPFQTVSFVSVPFQRWQFLGLSEAAPSTLQRACKVHPIAALQTEYSLWSRDPETEILKTCRELGVGFVAYSPLGRGFLTGRFKRLEDIPQDDWRRHHPRFEGENFQRNLHLAEIVRQMADEVGCTPAQLALAWVLGQGTDIVPIPGTKHTRYLEENVGALEVSLSSAQLRQLDAAFPMGVSAGARYHEAGMRAVNL